MSNINHPNTQLHQLTLQTHDYDGYLGSIYHQLVKSDTDSLLSFEESIDLINKWIEELPQNSPIISQSRKSIELIKSNKDLDPNNDKKNNIKVEELLPRVINIVKNFEQSGRNSFLTTLGEITQLGPCSQGITTRLLQFYIPYKY